jgi:hypothetical protein
MRRSLSRAFLVAVAAGATVSGLGMAAAGSAGAAPTGRTITLTPVGPADRDGSVLGRRGLHEQ